MWFVLSALQLCVSPTVFVSCDLYLQVLPADVLTRVSSYVEEVVAYVQKIIDNGFA